MKGGRVGKEEGGGSRTTPYKSWRHLARYNPCQKLVSTYFISVLPPNNAPGVLITEKRKNSRERGGGRQRERETYFIRANLSYCNFSAPPAERVYVFSLGREGATEVLTKL